MILRLSLMLLTRLLSLLIVGANADNADDAHAAADSDCDHHAAAIADESVDAAADHTVHSCHC